MRTAATLVLGGAVALCSPVLGASIGSESSIGLAADGNSNPFLVTSDAKAAESAAFLANVPITYTGDENTLDLIPRIRLAETHGDAQLLSNYQYLDADWRFINERNTLNASGGWHRDSTFYNVFENGALNGHTSYRQEDLANLSYARQLNERDGFQLIGFYDSIRYDAAVGQTLASYEYVQGAAEYDHQLGERWQASLTGGYGAFRLIQENYRSQQEFGQLGLNRSLTERWSLKAQLGYSWLQDRLVQPELICPVYYLYCYFGFVSYEHVQVTSRSTGSSPNGQLTLERHYERTTLDLAAARSVVPSGLGALVTQTDLKTTVNYQLSERWQLSTTLHGAALSNATAQSQIGNRRYANLDLSGNWQWTEHWLLQLSATGLVQDIDRHYSHALAFSIGAYRQFGRIRIR